MKRLLPICVISLLFVSGWGHALAAAFCPNMQEMPACHMQAAETSAHGHNGMEMDGMSHQPSASNGQAGSLKRPLVSCCASVPEAPPAPAVASRSVQQSKQDLGAILKPAPEAITPPAPSFARAVTSRQHAPPGAAAAPRHVLIQVFLI